MIDNMLIDLIR
jgi:hypothetical protein